MSTGTQVLNAAEGVQVKPPDAARRKQLRDQAKKGTNGAKPAPQLPDTKLQGPASAEPKPDDKPKVVAPEQEQRATLLAMLEVVTEFGDIRDLMTTFVDGFPKDQRLQAAQNVLAELPKERRGIARDSLKKSFKKEEFNKLGEVPIPADAQVPEEAPATVPPQGDATGGEARVPATDEVAENHEEPPAHILPVSEETAVALGITPETVAVPVETAADVTNLDGDGKEHAATPAPDPMAGLSRKERRYVRKHGKLPAPPTVNLSEAAATPVADPDQDWVGAIAANIQAQYQGKRVTEFEEDEGPGKTGKKQKKSKRSRDERDDPGHASSRVKVDVRPTPEMLELESDIARISAHAEAMLERLRFKTAMTAKDGEPVVIRTPVRYINAVVMRRLRALKKVLDERNFLKGKYLKAKTEAIRLHDAEVEAQRVQARSKRLARTETEIAQPPLMTNAIRSSREKARLIAESSSMNPTKSERRKAAQKAFRLGYQTTYDDLEVACAEGKISPAYFKRHAERLQYRDAERRKHDDMLLVAEGNLSVKEFHARWGKD